MSLTSLDEQTGEAIIAALGSVIRYVDAVADVAGAFNTESGGIVRDLARDVNHDFGGMILALRRRP